MQSTLKCKHTEKLKKIEESSKAAFDEMVWILRSITKNEVSEEELRDQLFLAGGCFQSIYHDQPPKDFDFYLKDRAFFQKHFLDTGIFPQPNATVGETGMMYDGPAVPSGVIETEEKDLIYWQASKYSIKMNDPYHRGALVPLSSKIYSLNICHFGAPEKVTDTFDFVHTMGFYTKDGLKIADNVMRCIRSKILEINPGNQSFSSLYTLTRALKRHNDGWRMPVKDVYLLASMIKSTPAIEIFGPLMDNEFPTAES